MAKQTPQVADKALLTAALHMVPAGAEKVTVPNYYDGSTMEIALDPRFTPPQNAQRYYKKYAKARTAIREKKLQLEETEEAITYLESVLTFAEQAPTPEAVEEVRQELPCPWREGSRIRPVLHAVPRVHEKGDSRDRRLGDR